MGSNVPESVPVYVCRRECGSGYEQELIQGNREKDYECFGDCVRSREAIINRSLHSQTTGTGTDANTGTRST